MEVFMDRTILITLALTIIVVSYLIYNFLRVNTTKKRFIDSSIELNTKIKKRWDSIPSIIEKGKKQMPHKKRIVESLILLRNTTYDNMSFEKKRSTDRKLDELIEELFTEEDIESRLIEKANSIRIEIEQSTKEYEKAKQEYDRILSKKMTRILLKITKLDTKLNAKEDQYIKQRKENR